jgi:hypothetical protein
MMRERIAAKKPKIVQIEKSIPLFRVYGVSLQTGKSTLWRWLTRLQDGPTTSTFDVVLDGRWRYRWASMGIKQACRETHEVRLALHSSMKSPLTSHDSRAGSVRIRCKPEPS